ncbi:MAG: DUF58 domain-containing protein [Steroidobacteraceae bacterium]
MSARIPGTAVQIPPEVRARLRSLRFGTRFLANGLGLGQHLGRSRGAGLEFEQYRSYEPGDEPRRVDWKLYARSDRFFVRDATRESPLCVWVLLDATASMAQADRSNPKWSKLAAAKQLCACLVEIAAAHGDAVGLIAITGGGIRLIPMGSGARHRDRLLLELEQIESAGAWPVEARLTSAWERIEPDSLVVVISDGFDALLPVFAARLAAARRQVISIGLVSREEREFPFVGGYVFRDPETGDECRVDAAAARTDYLARFSESRIDLRRRLGASGIPHVDHCIDEPADQPLRRLLGGSRWEQGSARAAPRRA